MSWSFHLIWLFCWFKYVSFFQYGKMWKMLKDYYAPQQNVLQKLSTCALDPSLLLAENSFLRWKYLPLAAALGQNVMSVRENPTSSQAFRNSKFQFQSWKLYSYSPAIKPSNCTTLVPNVLGWSMVKNLLETSKVMIISIFLFFIR